MDINADEEDYNCFICGKTVLDGTETIVEGDTAYLYHANCWNIHKEDKENKCYAR